MTEYQDGYEQALNDLRDFGEVIDFGVTKNEKYFIIREDKLIKMIINLKEEKEK